VAYVWRLYRHAGGVLFRVSRLCMALRCTPCYALVWRVMAYICGGMAECRRYGVPMADHRRCIAPGYAVTACG